MPDIASVLKAEIGRIARKELRLHVKSLKAATAGHRAEIVALKRRLAELERTLRRTKSPVAEASSGEDSEAALATRFSAKGFASNRRRLGLSAAELGRMLGVSGQTVYHWEDGKTRPRAKHMAAIARLRSMGKREVRARLTDQT